MGHDERDDRQTKDAAGETCKQRKQLVSTDSFCVDCCLSVCTFVIKAPRTKASREEGNYMLWGSTPYNPDICSGDLSALVPFYSCQGTLCK